MALIGISGAIAEIIGRKLDYDEERKKVLAYGAFGIIQTFFSIVLAVAAGLLFNVLLEAITILFTAAILRKFSGGAHSSTPAGCLLAGTVVIVLLALGVGRLLPAAGVYLMAIYVFAGIAFSMHAIKKYAPVDNPNKPIRREERKRKLKTSSIVFAGIVSVAAVVLFIIYIFSGKTGWVGSLSLAIATGMAWQSFTLIEPGHWFIARIDSAICILIKSKGGEKS